MCIRDRGTGDIHEGTQSTDGFAVLTADKTCRQVDNNSRTILLPSGHLADPTALFQDFGEDNGGLLLVIGKCQHGPAENLLQRITYKVNGGGISVGHPAFKIPENDAVDGRGDGIVLEAQFLECLPGTGDIHEGTQSTDRLVIIISDKTCRQVSNHARAVLLPPGHLADPATLF